jgi:hypothetical protein
LANRFLAPTMSNILPRSTRPGPLLAVGSANAKRADCKSVDER